MTEVRIASGIEIVMISVERQSAEKDQDHEPRQSRRDNAFKDDRRHCGLHERRLVADRVEAEARRQALAQFRQQRLHARDHVES